MNATQFYGAPGATVADGLTAAVAMAPTAALLDAGDDVRGRERRGGVWNDAGEGGGGRGDGGKGEGGRENLEASAVDLLGQVVHGHVAGCRH